MPLILKLFLAFLLSSANELTGAEAIQSATCSHTAVSYARVPIGFAFTSTTNIVITALGKQKEYGAWNPTNSTYEVQILDANSNLLAATWVFTNGTLINDYLYNPISPVAISPGTTNYVLAFLSYDFTNSGQYQWVGPTGWDNIQVYVAPELTYLGVAVGFGKLAHDFVPLSNGPNFQFAVASAPLHPQIQLPFLAGTNFIFAFSTVSHQSYTVQQNTNLATTNWTLYTNFLGNGSLYQFVTPASGNRQSFFRVRTP